MTTKVDASKPRGQREKEEELKSSARVQPEATANFKRLLFLDVGRLSEIRI